MTPNQQNFADEYIKCGNAAQAYRQAYPSCKTQRTAETNGSKLLRNAEVLEYIANKNKEIANDRIADMQEVKEFWTGILRSGTEETKDRLKASEMIAKTNGAFIDKVQVETDKPLEINISGAGDFDEC